MATLFGTLVGGVVDRVVRWVVLPVTSVIPVLVRTGILWLAFAGLWAALLLALVASPGALDDVWQAIGRLPLVGQALLWLLFLPLTAGLWTWSTDWPLVARVGVVLALAAWNLVVFLPRREAASPVSTLGEA